jgi:hypothetical protein
MRKHKNYTRTLWKIFIDNNPDLLWTIAVDPPSNILYRMFRKVELTVTEAIKEHTWQKNQN